MKRVLLAAALMLSSGLAMAAHVSAPTAMEVKERLERAGPTNGQHINVEVRGSTVYLTGSVEDGLARGTAGLVVGAMPGVETVVNGLIN